MISACLISEHIAATNTGTSYSNGGGVVANTVKMVKIGSNSLVDVLYFILLFYTAHFNMDEKK